MNRILLVEDNVMLGSLVKDAFERYLGLDVVHVYTLQSTKEILAEDDSFLLAVVDVKLPDALNGQAVDYVIKKGVPVVVFTAGGIGKTHEQFWNKKIVDYVLKDGPDKLQYLLYLVQRLIKNKEIKVLIVDDSPKSAEHIRELLQPQGLILLEADSGHEALSIINKHGDIALVITDYKLEDMDGEKLTKEIRQIKSRNKLAIIGISSFKKKELAAKFLKAGANDFIHKPLLAEEFYCRVNQNLQTIEYINTIQELSNTDFLTGLFNRRYFFDAANQLFLLSKRQDQPLGLAMFDIDYFKNVNDTYGHDVGDKVLIEISKLLQHRFRKSDIVSRFGGEEFCILLNNSQFHQSMQALEKCRRAIEKLEILLDGEKKIKVSVSIGLCNSEQNSLDEMITIADNLLYKAKESGRNKIEYE